MQTVYAAAPEIINLVEADRGCDAIDKILAFRSSGDETRYTLIRVLIATGQHRDDAVPVGAVGLPAGHRCSALRFGRMRVGGFSVAPDATEAS